MGCSDTPCVEGSGGGGREALDGGLPWGGEEKEDSSVAVRGWSSFSVPWAAVVEGNERGGSRMAMAAFNGPWACRSGGVPHGEGGWCRRFWKVGKERGKDMGTASSGGGEAAAVASCGTPPLVSCPVGEEPMVPTEEYVSSAVCGSVRFEEERKYGEGDAVDVTEARLEKEEEEEGKECDGLSNHEKGGIGRSEGAGTSGGERNTCTAGEVGSEESGGTGTGRTFPSIGGERKLSVG